MRIYRNVCIASEEQGPPYQGVHGTSQAIFFSLEDALEMAKLYQYTTQKYAYTISYEVEKHEPKDSQ